MMNATLKNSSYDTLYETFDKLAEAINYYLSYLELVAVPESDRKRGNTPHFITESAVRLPISEYLERRAGVSNLALEYPYPRIHLKRCDFAFDVSKGLETKQECLAELKYAKSSVECQDYFDDLLRLHFAKIDEPQKRCFFIVCGASGNYVSKFKNKTISTEVLPVQDSPKEKYRTATSKDREKNKEVKKNYINENWLSFDINNPEVHITESLISPYWETFKSTHMFAYDSNKKEKVERDDIMPSDIKTIMVCSLGKEQGFPHSVGIWEIE